MEKLRRVLAAIMAALRSHGEAVGELDGVCQSLERQVEDLRNQIQNLPSVAGALDLEEAEVQAMEQECHRLVRSAKALVQRRATL